MLSATTQRAFRSMVDILSTLWWSRLIWHNFGKVAWNATSLLLVNTIWKVRRTILTSRELVLTVITSTAERSIRNLKRGRGTFQVYIFKSVQNSIFFHFFSGEPLPLALQYAPARSINWLVISSVYWLVCMWTVLIRYGEILSYFGYG